jgi:hypothetical protein
MGWSHNINKELKGQLPGPEQIAKLLEAGQ